MRKVFLIIVCVAIFVCIWSFITNDADVLVVEPVLTSVYSSVIPRMHRAALVLEGGSLRSVYTSGVLDVFMENGIQFELIVAVSAGALNAGNFVANHVGRSARINILHSNDPRYFGFRQLIFHRRAFNFDYLFFSPIKDLYPYDEEALKNSQQRLLIATTNIHTGKVEYFERNTYSEFVHVLQASSSIPLLSQPVNIEGNYFLDGAIADPIGLHKAFSEGFDRVVVVLTNHADHRLSQRSLLERLIIRLHERRYPKLMNVIRSRHLMYNSLIEEINRMEEENQIFVIRPSRKFRIGAMERDARRLFELYFQGRDDARRLLPSMIEFIERENYLYCEKPNILGLKI